MSPWLRRGRVLGAALLLWAAPLWAAPEKLADIQAPLGSGAPTVSVAPSLSPLAPAPLAPLAPAIPGLAAAGPVGLGPAVSPAAIAPAAAPAAARAPSIPGAPRTFGKRVTAPAEAPRLGTEAFQRTLDDFSGGAAQIRSLTGGAGGSAPDGQRAQAASSALFDLASQRDADASSAVAADLPRNNVGPVLARLRAAGQRHGPGPGSIPGMSGVTWAGLAGRGQSGETSKVLIDGKTWFLKRLGSSPDPEIAALPKETRAANEAGVAAMLRADPQLSRSFTVPARLSVFRDGDAVFVLSEGLPSVGDGESKRQELSPEQRADAAIIQLVLGMGDMHGGDVLPLEGGGFGLVDFEKLSRAPLETATRQQIDDQVFMKSFPLVDRMSANDPALYRARFQTWLTDYRGGGRARMDRALEEAGWSRGSREAYLSAVDRNAATYLERLQPYLDYGNEWHQRILKARAEQARQHAASSSKKGLFSGLFGR